VTMIGLLFILLILPKDDLPEIRKTVPGWSSLSYLSLHSLLLTSACFP
jgi:hypothetical protein